MRVRASERKRQKKEQAMMYSHKRRRLMIRVGIAAGVLLLCVLLLVIFTRKDKKPVAQVVAGAEGTTTIHIVFGGDVNVTDKVVASGGADYDYSRTFMDVAHIIGDADLAAVNFEGLLYGEPYGEAGKGSAPQQMMDALDAAGVDLVQIANSYSLNRGVSGLGFTVDGIRQAGMEPVGAYGSAEDARVGEGYVLCEVNGVRIAFVAFTKGMSGYSIPKESAGCVNVLYSDYNDNYQKVDTDGIKKVLKAAEKAEPDVTIAMLHWGSEHNDAISASQEEIMELMMNNGVDAIVGTHAHRVQQMVYDAEKGTFVAYCLGDLIGDAPRAGSEYSVLLDLQITKHMASGETKITGFDYTPIYTVREEGKPTRVVRIDDAIKAYESGYIDAVTPETYESMKNARSRIEARIKGE